MKRQMRLDVQIDRTVYSVPAKVGYEIRRLREQVDRLQNGEKRETHTGISLGRLIDDIEFHETGKLSCQKQP